MTPSDVLRRVAHPSPRDLARLAAALTVLIAPWIITATVEPSELDATTSPVEAVARVALAVALGFSALICSAEAIVLLIAVSLLEIAVPLLVILGVVKVANRLLDRLARRRPREGTP